MALETRQRGIRNGLRAENDRILATSANDAGHQPLYHF